MKEAEEYFKNVHMTQDQHKMFLDFVNILFRYVSIGELAAKDITWRAISKWQLEHKRDLLGLENEPPETQIQSLDQLLNILKMDLIAVLEDPEQEKLVEKAIAEMMKFF